MSGNILSVASQELLNYVYQTMSNLVSIEKFIYNDTLHEEFNSEHLQEVTNKFKILLNAPGQELKAQTISLPGYMNIDTVVHQIIHNEYGTDTIFFVNMYNEHNTKKMKEYFILALDEYSFEPGYHAVTGTEDCFSSMYQYTIWNLFEKLYVHERPAIFFRQFPMNTDNVHSKYDIIRILNFLGGPFNLVGRFAKEVTELSKSFPGDIKDEYFKIFHNGIVLLKFNDIRIRIHVDIVDDEYDDETIILKRITSETFYSLYSKYASLTEPSVIKHSINEEVEEINKYLHKMIIVSELTYNDDMLDSIKIYM